MRGGGVVPGAWGWGGGLEAGLGGSCPTAEGLGAVLAAGGGRASCPAAGAGSCPWGGCGDLWTLGRARGDAWVRGGGHTGDVGWGELKWGWTSPTLPAPNGCVAGRMAEEEAKVGGAPCGGLPPGVPEGGLREGVLEVEGAPPGAAEELLVLYFESRRRSGGGPVRSCQRLGSLLFLTFEESRGKLRDQSPLGALGWAGGSPSPHWEHWGGVWEAPIPNREH